MTIAWLPADLHFLRPWALWGLAVLLPLLWLATRHQGAERLAVWRGLIDDQLLEALTIDGGPRTGVQPIHTITLALALGITGLAGPAWQHEPMPLLEDRAPLVVALDLSASMDAVDESPTRLERAKLKLRSLLARRQGARTALLVFGNSAHRVLPLGEDPNLLLGYVPDLSTELMPHAGAAGTKATAAALALASHMLEREPTPGSILFLTDGFDTAQARDFLAFREHSRSEALLLAFGGDVPALVRSSDGVYLRQADGSAVTVRMGRDGLEAAAAGGLWLASATADDRDLDAIEARIQRHMITALAADPQARWRDEGLWLVLPAAVLVLLSFRRGWVVGWGQAFIVPLCLLLATLAPTGGAQADPGSARAWQPMDLWASGDQQGRWYFEHGRFEAAADAFVDPLWRGIALYRAGRFTAAADAFATLNTPEGLYNLGNALARLQRYAEAVATYDQALERRPGWRDALHNRALVAALLPDEEDEAHDDAEGSAAELDPSRLGERRKGQKPEHRQSISEAEITRHWLDRIPLGPAGFLKRRFAWEVEQAEGATLREGTP